MFLNNYNYIIMRLVCKVKKEISKKLIFLPETSKKMIVIVKK